MRDRGELSMTQIPLTGNTSVRNQIRLNGIKRLMVAALCIMPVVSCSDPIGVDELSDFMILAPGDYFFQTPVTLRPSAVTADSVLFRWEEARGAERYTIVFAQAQTLADLTAYRADLSATSFTIPVAQPQAITIPYGTPNPLLDTIPVAQYPALQHVLKLRDLDTTLASQPKGVPLYYVWSIQAHKGSQTSRSIEMHRLIIIRS